MNNELKQIKKIYGEEMMHLCREMFPSLLEKEGLLLSILENNLAPTHSFADDIKEHNLYEEFKDWIYSFVDVEKKDMVVTEKTPFELMDEAGYTLYECKTEEDIQSFRKYYADGEVLCTIYNGGRLNRCHVFFDVKKNIDEIKRENFTNPQREDEYGTSVISIQFSRGKINDLSIKNRYNHTIKNNNPDATFSNNLENIIPGLTYSFEKYYGLNINQNTNRESVFLTDNLSYVKSNDGKYYRYNLEIGGIYYCENNIIVQDGDVITKYRDNPERYILIDQYVVDLKEKDIILFNGDVNKDAFIKSISDVGTVKRINILKDKDKRIILIQYDSNDEEKKIQNAGEAFLGSLNETEVEMLGLTEAVVDNMYTEYALADKVYREIIADVNPEISDDEARIIRVQVIFFSTTMKDGAGRRVDYTGREKETVYQTALSVKEMADGGEKNFEDLAVQYSDDTEITFSFGKNEVEKSIEDAAFNLANGEISDVIQGENGYYIIRCISTFDREETDANKLKLVEQRKDEAFGAEYDIFVQGLVRNLNEELWNSIVMIRDEKVKTSDFFEVYSKYFE